MARRSLQLPFYGFPKNFRSWIASFLIVRSIKVDSFGSDYTPVKDSVLLGCVLFPTLFLLHIRDMLEIVLSHDSTMDAVYFGCAKISRENVDQCQKLSLRHYLGNISF